MCKMVDLKIWTMLQVSSEGSTILHKCKMVDFEISCPILECHWFLGADPIVYAPLLVPSVLQNSSEVFHHFAHVQNGGFRGLKCVSGFFRSFLGSHPESFPWDLPLGIVNVCFEHEHFRTLAISRCRSSQNRHVRGTQKICHIWQVRHFVFTSDRFLESLPEPFPWDLPPRNHQCVFRTRTFSNVDDF